MSRKYITDVYIFCELPSSKWYKNFITDQFLRNVRINDNQRVTLIQITSNYFKLQQCHLATTFMEVFTVNFWYFKWCLCWWMSWCTRHYRKFFGLKTWQYLKTFSLFSILLQFLCVRWLSIQYNDWCKYTI